MLINHGFLSDNEDEEVATLTQCDTDLQFSLFNPVEASLEYLTSLESDSWVSMVTRKGVNTLYMTFPFCHGKLLEKIGRTRVEAYDLWMQNSLTHAYEPVSVWARRDCHNLAKSWIRDCFDFWFEKGEGMIGKVGAREKWVPNKEQTLGEDSSFLRHAHAQQVGLRRGDAIWFPFNSHRFVLGYYTSDSWIDENLRSTILEKPIRVSNRISHDQGTAMDVESTVRGSRICIEELS